MKVEKTRIFGLDVMRAMAILMVVSAHSLYIFDGYQNPFFDFMRVIGVYGVEVFFVLSGFLIGRILLRLIMETNFTSKIVLHFWIRRWFRTLPLYFLMLLVNIMVAICIGYNLPDDLWKYFFFLQNIVSEHITFFPESWSLSVEEFAYLLAPVCLLLFTRFIFKRDRAFLIGSILLTVIFFLTKIYYQLEYAEKYQTMLLWNSHLKAVVVYRLDAIFYGFIMAYLFQMKFEAIKRMKFKLLIIGGLVCVVVLFVIPMFGIFIENYSWYWNVLYLPLNSIGIALMVPHLYFLKTPKSYLEKITEQVSLYSYAMYLLHYTFILYLMQVILDFSSLSFLQRLACLVTYFALIFVLSKLIFTYFERPFTNLRDSKMIKQIFLK